MFAMFMDLSELNSRQPLLLFFQSKCGISDIKPSVRCHGSAWEFSGTSETTGNGQEVSELKNKGCSTTVNRTYL